MTSDEEKCPRCQSTAFVERIKYNDFRYSTETLFLCNQCHQEFKVAERKNAR